MFLLFNKLFEALEKSNNILFVAHRSPDPDTIGSALALGEFAKSLGKTTSYFCPDKLPKNFEILEGAEKFFSDSSLVSNNPYDAICFMDCGDVGRIGIFETLKVSKKLWIKIDHHLTKENFMDIEIRDSGSSATCEIVYKFLNYNKFPLTGKTATALLAGILIDTNLLSNAAARGEVISMAGELISCGANYRAIIKSFYFNKSQEILNLWGVALSRLKYNKEKDIITTAIFGEDLISYRDPEEMLSGLPNFLNALLKTKLVLVLQENKDSVRGSLRTSENNFDVSKIAENFGGGGHFRAAGFLCQGKICELENEWTVKRT